MPAGDAIRTRRTTRYHVETREPGGGWAHIHPPGWECIEDLRDARPFAAEVRAARPDAEVRIVGTDSVEVTNLRTGAVSWLDLGSKAQTYL